MCDFNLSRYIGAAEVLDDPQPLHSPGWQSPEMLMSGSYGRPTDVRAFLPLCLGGARPQRAARAAAAHRPPPPPSIPGPATRL